MILSRVAYTPHGTFGVLIDNFIPFAVTLELPWKNNAKNISCIPTGNYRCERFLRANGQETFEIKDVPDRTVILFHVANTVADLKGCVGVAEEFGILNDVPAVLASGRGFNEFIDKLIGIEAFEINIRDCL